MSPSCGTRGWEALVLRVAGAKGVLRGDGWAGGPIVAMPRGWGDRRLPWWGGICPCVSRREQCQWEHGLGSRHGVTPEHSPGRVLLAGALPATLATEVSLAPVTPPVRIFSGRRRAIWEGLET